MYIYTYTHIYIYVYIYIHVRRVSLKFRYPVFSICKKNINARNMVLRSRSGASNFSFNKISMQKRVRDKKLANHLTFYLPQTNIFYLLPNLRYKAARGWNMILTSFS